MKYHDIAIRELSEGFRNVGVKLVMEAFYLLYSEKMLLSVGLVT